MIKVTIFNDPACPWGYSESPALRVLEWRYGDQLEWNLVLVGLSEDTSRYVAHGFTTLRMAQSGVHFRDKYGMPFSIEVKPGFSASTRACRAVIAARQQWPGSEWRVFRALQFGNFNTGLLFDDDDAMRATLNAVPGIDGDLVVSLIDSPEVIEEYEQGKAKTRTAAGSPTEFQGKAGNSDGAVRYTAPSLFFEGEDGRGLEAGGFQPVEAYDVLIANLDPTLERKAPPEDVGELLEFFPYGVTTQEVAAVMAAGNDSPDRRAAEAALLALQAAGRAIRHPLGDDALWLPGAELATAGSAASGSAARAE